jgi:hypothetical protein
MKDNNIENLFDLPKRELKALSFCRTDKVSMEAWVKSLPIADVGKSTRMLYVAAKEVCDLDTSAATRLDLLNALRPAIHYACIGLRKSYLNQPIILPEQPRKIAALCQALQGYLATGYLISACQCNEKMGNIIKKPTALMSHAIYNALIEYSNMLMRDYLLYNPSPAGFWKKVHRLFQLARKYNLHTTVINNDELDDSSSHIEHCYMQLLLWGCIKANQLRQDDILRLEKNVWAWARWVKLAALDKNSEAAFVVDPSMDIPPIYQKFYTGKYHPSCQSLDTTVLTEKLKDLSAPLAQKQSGLSSNLINHLILAWGVFTGRTFMRLEANSDLSLCIGLTTTHYYLANNKPFAEFIYGKNAPESSKTSTTSEFKEQLRPSEKLDVWDESIFGTNSKSEAQVTMESIDYHIKNGGQSMMTFTGSDKEKYMDYRVSVVNMSPGGYCLEWDNNIPHTIKAGEIIGVKEAHHNTWNIGSIRWVRQNKEKSLQIGVELLSPNATPYGARTADFDGNPKSDFMRVLVLPEIKAAGQPSSILTPAVTFKTGQYVLLANDGQEHCIMLKKLLSSTGSYFQFAFEPVKSVASQPSSGKIKGLNDKPDESDLDSVWNLL